VTSKPDFELKPDPFADQLKVIGKPIKPIEIDPKEIPSFMERIPFRVLQYGVTFGLIIWGYTCRNYMEYAVETGGYETLIHDKSRVARSRIARWRMATGFTAIGI